MKNNYVARIDDTLRDYIEKLIKNNPDDFASDGANNRLVKKYFEDKVYKTVIPRNVRLSEAPSYGMPITVYDPRSKGAKAYEKFAKELLKNN